MANWIWEWWIGGSSFWGCTGSFGEVACFWHKGLLRSPSPSLLVSLNLVFLFFCHLRFCVFSVFFVATVHNIFICMSTWIPTSGHTHTLMIQTCEREPINASFLAFYGVSNLTSMFFFFLNVTTQLDIYERTKNTLKMTWLQLFQLSHFWCDCFSLERERHC